MTSDPDVQRVLETWRFLQLSALAGAEHLPFKSSNDVKC